MSLPVPADPTDDERPPVDPGAPASPRPHPRTRVLLEWLAILAVAGLAAILIRAFLIQPFSIPSGSMEPTLKDHDRLLVNKLSYDFHNVHRGDIVVFKKPADENAPRHHGPCQAGCRPSWRDDLRPRGADIRQRPVPASTLAPEG